MARARRNGSRLSHISEEEWPGTPGGACNSVVTSLGRAMHFGFLA